MNNIEVYSPQPENFREITKELTTQYCQLRHKHEKDLKAYKDSFKKEIADYIQNIIESGISKRNIEYHRSAFEKLVNICDYSSPTQKVKTPEDIAEYIFSMLIQTISENKSNTMFAYKEQYMEAYDSIISYYKKYFEIKFAINEFKKNNSEELNFIVKEIQENGIPMFIVKYVYKRLKIDSAAINVSPGEFSYCDELYSEMKEELLKIL